ncbi:hypothetical protein LEN26_015577, partial [Aphanomyces euteiches]
MQGDADRKNDRSGGHRASLNDAAYSGDLELSRRELLPMVRLTSTPLHVASQEGHLDVVKHLVLNGASVDTADKDRQSPLHLASQSGHLDVVKHLLDKRAFVNAVDRMDRTPLHLASNAGHLEVVKHLVDNGANVDAIERSLVHLLDKGADINPANVVGRKLLLLASQKGQFDVVKHLLDQGADINTTDKEHRTPLHLASKEGHSDVVELLLDKGAGVNIADKFGWTSLHFAAYSRHKDIVMLLMDAGADMNIETNDGEKACDICNDENLKAILKLDNIRRCFRKDMVPFLANNPKTVSFLADPFLYAKLRIIQQKPSAFYKHKNDPRILVAFTELEKITSPNAEHKSHSTQKGFLITKDSS